MVEPQRRLTAAEALAHPWINKPIGPGPPLTLTQRNMQRTRQPRRRFKVRRRHRASNQTSGQPQYVFKICIDFMWRRSRRNRRC